MKIFSISEKNKAISIVSLILLLLSSVFLVQGIKYSNKNLADNVKLAKNHMNEVLTLVTDFSFTPYESRIAGIVSTHKEILEAFTQQKKKLLYQLVLPRYELLKKENNFFYLFNFHLADGTTLLRMHNPDVYDDTTLPVQPIVAAVHTAKTRLSGFEAGQDGIFYRIVYPVFAQKKYLGAIEFGIKSQEVLATVENWIKSPATFFIHPGASGENAYFQETEKTFPSSYRLIASGNRIFSSLSSNLSFEQDDQHFTYDQKNYIVHVQPLLKDYQEKTIGGLVVLQDITALIAAKNSFIVRAVFFTSVLFLIAVLVLYFTFGKIVGQLVHAEKKASEAKETWERTFDAVPDQIFIMDNKCQIIHANRAMSEILGISVEKLIHSKCYKAMHGIDALPSYCPYTDLLEDHRPHTADYFDDRLQRYFTMSIAPLRDKEGDFFGSVHIIRDLTEQKRREEESVQLQEQLRQAQKMESIGTLAGGIAHDFNNILTAIIGYSELCRASINTPAKLENHITEVLKATERAKKLVQQILTFGRKSAYEKHALQISLVIKEALKLLRSSIPTIIEIKEDIRSDALVLADPTQIYQIVMNLCTNAYHAMRETGGRLAVTLKTVALTEPTEMSGIQLVAGNYVQLTISDSGTGLDEETKRKIFEPYFTTKGLGEGTGLGLAVVHGIVQSFDGCIHVLSEPGQGTTFHIYLPLYEGELEEQLPEEQKSTMEGGNETIMLVDDDVSIANLSKEILNSHGYEVHAFSNGMEAYHAFRENPQRYDLIITDMTMPFMTGADLAQEAMKIRPTIPIILCTGYSELVDDGSALFIGITEYCKKPLNTEELLSVVRKTLDAVNLNGLRVVFVDDLKFITDLGRLVLERLGCQVTVATSGQEALALVRDTPDGFDIIISDQNMPNMTGLELAQEIVVICPDIPILLMTGNENISDEMENRSSNISEVLNKPLEERALIRAISKAIHKQYIS